VESEKIIVADSSPLVGLARIDQLSLLPKLAARVVVPEFVWQEVTQAKADAPGANEVLSQSWIEVLAADAEKTSAFLKYVDRGEAEALALAQSLEGSLLLIDERKGRQVADQFGIRRVGTLGLLVKAKDAGWIARVRPLVEALAAVNIYIRPEICEAVLREIGE